MLVYPASVQELSNVIDMGGGVSVGAGLSLSKVDQKAKSVMNTLPSHKTGVFQAMIEMLRWFAGPQIRNVAVSVMCIS